LGTAPYKTRAVILCHGKVRCKLPEERFGMAELARVNIPAESDSADRASISPFTPLFLYSLFPNPPSHQ